MNLMWIWKYEKTPIQSNTILHVYCFCFVVKTINLYYFIFKFFFFSVERHGGSTVIARTTSFDSILCCIFFFKEKRIKWSIEQPHHSLLNSIPFYLPLWCTQCTHTHIDIFNSCWNGHIRHCWEVLPSAQYIWCWQLLGIGKQWKQQPANEQTDGWMNEWMNDANVYGCIEQASNETEQHLLRATEFNLQRINTPLFKDTR